MNHSSLQDFMQPALTCLQTDTLQAVLANGSSARHLPGQFLIVVDSQHQPLGYLNPLRLLSDQLHSETSAGGTTPLQDLCSSQPSQTDPVIQPLVTLPANLPLADFWLFLQTQSLQSQQPLGLLDSRGRLVGLLNLNHLLQTIALDSTLLSPPPPPRTALGFAELMPALVQLLEQLPWALRLQTQGGEVVADNPYWQTEMGQLVDPAGVTQQITEQWTLESVPSPGPLQAFAPAPTTGESQVRTCICTCQRQDGQTTTWQFLKIPLINPLPGQHCQDFHLARVDSPENPPQQEPVGGNSDWQKPLWLILVQDLSDQQQTAQELAAKNADLTELNRLKDEFLACISHELKTPLTAILGLTSVLKEQGIGALSSRQERYVRLIYQSSRQLMGVISDILDLTRLETHQLELLPEPVEIRSICDRALEQVHRLYLEDMAETVKGELAQSIQLEIEPGLETFAADTLRLRQMLVNLLSNALKFTDASGAVGLKVSYWHGWLVFTVWDTGIGIPADKQHLIFQKFHQLENSLSRRYPGIGLGLILTQRLARLHGGEVTFTSQESRGSQFTLLLPTCPPEPSSTSPRGDWQPLASAKLTANDHQGSALRHPHQTSLTPGMILVVETSTQALARLVTPVTEQGCQIVVARSGTEAIEKARRLQPALVLLNPLLPLLSGWDVLTLLKGNPATAQIPTIIMAPTSEKARGFRQGADGFLSLPVQESDLQNLLQHHCPARPAAGGPAEAQNPPAIAASTSPYPPQPFANLTVLRLDCGLLEEAKLETSDPDPFSAARQVAHGFCDRHLHDCHLLDATDLDQAELLASLWHPDLILVAWEPSLHFFELLSQRSALASLPLVTLTTDTTFTATQVPGLAVFPVSGATQTLLDSSTLLSVLQTATGMNRKPMVLTLDGVSPIAALAQEWPETAADPSGQSSHLFQASQWLQALNQYLQAAGFKVVQGQSLLDLQRLVTQQPPDLLLISLRGTPLSRPPQGGAQASLITCLQSLRADSPDLPIWLLNVSQQRIEPELFALINSLNLRVMPATTTIPDLVHALWQQLQPQATPS